MMMYMIIGTLAALLALTSAQISDVCIDCIAKVEQGETGVCEAKFGHLYCGVYKITEPYWIDCREPKPTGLVGVKDRKEIYQQCVSDEACARSCIKTYMERYQPLCKTELSKSALSCEDYGRLHNGGPFGCAHNFTQIGYVESLMRPLCVAELRIDQGLPPLTTAAPSTDLDLNITAFPTADFNMTSILVLNETDSFNMTSGSNDTVDFNISTTAETPTSTGILLFP